MRSIQAYHLSAPLSETAVLPNELCTVFETVHPFQTACSLTISRRYAIINACGKPHGFRRPSSFTMFKEKAMNTLLKEKINEIADADSIEDDSTVTLAELTQFEQEKGIRIPDAYKDFLTQQCAFYVVDDYGFPMLETSDMTSDDGCEKIELFYNREFITGSDAFIRNWGKKVLPIGENMGGDYVCIGVSGERFGKIYFLYHEDEEREDGLYLIANSFEDFILSIVNIGW